MRILYVNDAMAIWGGLERILVDKMNLFAQEDGYEVFLVTANQGKHPIPYSLHPQVHYSDLDIRFHQEYQYRGLKRLLKHLQLRKMFRLRLSDFIKAVRPDIIICTRIEMLKTVSKVKGRIPLVYESHTSCQAVRFMSEERLKLMYADFMNRSAKTVQMVVALTEGDATEWRKINPRVAVIPNVVHLNQSGIYTDGHSKSAVFVGRFSGQKDVDSLLKVWKLVVQRHADWQLHIYGGFGEQQDKLLSEIGQMSANIVIHEPTPMILDEYAHYSMLLLTSRFEPFGLVMPEAMSCGLPVVAFDCPYGPADIITDGVDGFLIPNRSVELFAEKVCWLIEHPDVRMKMGQTGILSSQRYKSSRILPLWKQLFEQLSTDSK